MTRIDFYVLPEGAAREAFVCRLAEKAYRKEQRVYIHTASQTHAAALDGLLWTFRGGSFVPHEIHQPQAVPESPIVIGHEGGPPLAKEYQSEVLINLSDTLPEFFSRFLRVVEIVDSDADVKLKARERFRYYRERGYPIESHQIDAAQLSATYEGE